MCRIGILEKNEYPEALKSYIDKQKGNKGVTTYRKDGEEYTVIMGSKRSTGGFSLEISDQNWTDDHHVTMTVRLKKPGEDQMVVQSITYPCLVIKKPEGVTVEVKLTEEGKTSC